jgi:riboflavin kinase/FMN adenylyltransferase
MQVYHLTSRTALPSEGMPVTQVLAIGEFDGVHLGHREVITRAVETAGRLALPASIMTFHPHPREALGQEKYSRVLTPLDDKLELFRALGVQFVYVIAFDEAFSRLEPEQFVSDILLKLGTESVVVGFDFRFGFKGRGTADSLCESARGRFAVEVVRAYHLKSDKVSSTLVRELLQQGRADEASLLLGRPYSLSGTVVHGQGRGRTIGFPTANIEPGEAYVIPGNGVYAVRVHALGRLHGGVMNIGVKPTFGEGLRPSLEVHLFEFQANLYGSDIRIDFIAYLRGERKFSGVDELVAQIRTDAEEAKQILHALR